MLIRIQPEFYLLPGSTKRHLQVILHWLPMPYKLIVTTTAPIFTLNMADITEENGGMIGGYTYDQKHYNQQLIHTISEILTGKPAREIPLYAIRWRTYYQLYDITP